jgi:low affinity Fe/Cu permease
MNERFRKFSQTCSLALGTPHSFAVAVALVAIWLCTGPLFHFSDAWQLVINTSTTIITFLMVFIIQATQNRDSAAIQLKLDELLRAIHSARTSLVRLEEWGEDDLAKLREEFEKLSRQKAKPVS